MYDSPEDRTLTLKMRPRHPVTKHIIDITADVDTLTGQTRYGVLCDDPIPTPFMNALHHQVLHICQKELEYVNLMVRLAYMS